MKIRACLVIIFLFSFCFTTQAQSHHHPQQHDAQWALAKIKALPEVKEYMRHAKKEKPMVINSGDPDSTRNYYWIKVGISNFDMFRTTYDFDVDPKTSRIYLEQIWLWLKPGAHRATLQQWRRWRLDPRFNKPHIFRKGKLIALKEKEKVIHGKKESS